MGDQDHVVKQVILADDCPGDVDLGDAAVCQEIAAVVGDAETVFEAQDLGDERMDVEIGVALDLAAGVRDNGEESEGADCIFGPSVLAVLGSVGRARTAGDACSPEIGGAPSWSFRPRRG
ncbi:MAG: hypothetical protein GDA40_11810 [Rhodobacteraceae bacterium]|nr:hypothetical protein [Paracoccaceae bacterium]